MTLRECTTAAILTGQTHIVTVHEQTAKRQCLGRGPIKWLITGKHGFFGFHQTADFGIQIKPVRHCCNTVADLIELLGRHSGLSQDDPRRDTIALATPLGRMISPLSLTPKVPMSGRFIYAGLADQVVHPREQVNRLWDHWGRPEIEWYRGGHAGFFQSRPVQQFVTDALIQSGLVTGADPADRSGRPDTKTG